MAASEVPAARAVSVADLTAGTYEAMLVSLPESQVVDGDLTKNMSGSISLELVSRGCNRVVSVEADRDHANFIRQCFKKLGDESDLLIRCDVFRFLKSCHQKFDFIFADPPYALKELPEIPRLILEGDLLNEGGIFVFEHGKNYDFSDHPRFLEHRSYGSVNFSIFR